MGAKFLEFNDVVLSVVGNILIDSEVFMMTSPILKICRVSEDAHRSRVCVYAFIWMNVRSL